MGARFDAILFDAGGVLVLPDPTVMGPVVAPYGGSLEIDVHHRAHYAAMRAHDTAPDDDTDWHRYHDAYLRWVGVPEGEMEEALEVFRPSLHPWLWRYPNPGAANALADLVERGVPIGVVSNASGQIERALARAGVCQVGDGDGAVVACVIDSYVVGVEKPDPRIFDTALERLGVAAKRVAYVGDSARYDVRGAEAAGLTALQLDPYGDADGEPHERITSLWTLLDWV